MKWTVLLGILFVASLGSAAAADEYRPSLDEAEETYELRLQKIQRAGGDVALFATLKQDM